MPRKFYRYKRKRTRRVPKSTKKYVKRVLDNRIEDKALAYSQTVAIPIGAQFTPHYINATGLGPEVDDRIAERIRMKNVEIRCEIGQITAGLPGTLATYTYRMMLVYDRQANATGITLNQLFWNAGSGVSYLSVLNPAGKPRFTVLYDKTFTMSIGGGAANVSETRFHVIKKKLGGVNGLKTVYNSQSTGTIADIVTGSLCFVLISDADQLDYKYFSLIRYEDA